MGGGYVPVEGDFGAFVGVGHFGGIDQIVLDWISGGGVVNRRMVCTLSYM